MFSYSFTAHKSPFLHEKSRLKDVCAADGTKEQQIWLRNAWMASYGRQGIVFAAVYTTLGKQSFKDTSCHAIKPRLG